MSHSHDNHSGHDAHSGRGNMDHTNHHAMMARDFRNRFFIALALSVPVLALSPSIQNWFNFSLPTFPGEKFVLFALASIIALYTAWPFYTSAKSEILSGNWGMMTLVSLAVLSGYFYSVATTFFIPGDGFYWEIATLVLVLLLGHWLEMRAVVSASGALRELAKLIPPTAQRVKGDGSIEEVQTEALQRGDMVLVRPGAKVPIDGVIIKGASAVNESMITGESKPVQKNEGNEVIGGSINGDGALTVQITKIGKETALAQIIELVGRTQASKPKTQRMADRAAHWLTIIAIVVGLGTFVVWAFIFTKGILFALTLAITVVVITCPHALGLAIPTVTTITTAKAARDGILIRDMDGLERARDIDYVVFDKTGTLTEGGFGINAVSGFSGWDENRVLALAASLDKYSEHTIAKAIVHEAERRNLTLQNVEGYSSVPGRGSFGSISEKPVFVGNEKMMQERHIDITSARAVMEQYAQGGYTMAYVAEGITVVGSIALSDKIRPDSLRVIQALHERGVKVAMLTGDTAEVAKRVANELGIDTFFAQVLPEDKVEKVKALQLQGHTVMMVGDGVNDAAALTQADVGVAIGAGTDVAAASAEIVLVKNNPLDVVKLMILSQKTMTKMRQNLWWATGYNIIAIPLAAGVLYNWGILLRPEWGALAMTASSIIVVFNALLLKGASIERPQMQMENVSNS